MFGIVLLNILQNLLISYSFIIGTYPTTSEDIYSKCPGLQNVDNPYVFVTITPKSFYRQCFPSASIDLGLSFTAMHWLQKRYWIDS